MGQERDKEDEDESYNKGCDESTSQGLNCAPKPLVIDSEDREKT
jgi:hypothetical protein